jgi:hypothetical protein
VAEPGAVALLEHRFSGAEVERGQVPGVRDALALPADDVDEAVRQRRLRHGRRRALGPVLPHDPAAVAVGVDVDAIDARCGDAAADRPDRSAVAVVVGHDQSPVHRDEGVVGGTRSLLEHRDAADLTLARHLSTSAVDHDVHRVGVVGDGHPLVVHECRRGARPR